jgi:exodeoxyribonuclease-3
MPTVKLATYNINGIRARHARLLEWLAREKPDIVCLQELKANDAAFPLNEIRAQGYSARWVGQVSWNGVAVLARGAEIKERHRALPGDASDSHSRYLEVEVNGLIVACLYLPNGNPQPGPKFEYKLAWFERLIKHAKTLVASKQPVILAGDFNVVPTDFDIYDPTHWRKDALLQPESRACYERLLKQGWLDSLRHKHPDEKIFTFWDYFRNHWKRNAGLRIDHLLLNKTLGPHLEDSNVDRWVRDQEGASDHAPTWVTLSIGTKPKAKKTANKAAKKALPNKKAAARSPVKKSARAKP